MSEEPYSIVWSYPLGEELRTSNHCTIETVIIQDKNVLFFGVTEQTTHKDYICAFNLDTHSVQWKREIPQVTSSMCVQDTILYVGSMGILCAFNTDNGDILWQKESEKGWFEYPIVVGDIVYVYHEAYMSRYNGPLPQASEGSYYLYALHASTGKEIWKLTIDFLGITDPPSYNNGVLYFGTYIGNAYAVNADDGEIVWKKELAKFITSKTCYDGSHIFIVGQQEKTITHDTSYLYALNAETGDTVWSYTAPDEYDNMSDFSPVVSENVLYIYCSTSYDHQYSEQYLLCALDVRTGCEIWRFATNELLRKHPVIQGDTIYISGFALVALDRKTGLEKWKYPIQKDPERPTKSLYIQSSPYILNDVLYFVDDQGVYYALQDHAS
jgi:outer membrane protein assembly factor BamB